MNLFQLVLKNMRQRALGTWLTLLSVLLGVALAISVMILLREGENLFGQSDYGVDVIVGPKGSPLQLTLNTIYHLDRSPGVIPYSMYEQMATRFRPEVRRAIPYAVGDSYKGHRIVGTTAKLFGSSEDGATFDPATASEYRRGSRYSIANGKPFHPLKFEAVVGSDVSTETGLKIGDTFQASHGVPKPGDIEDIHDEKWTVVGVLEKTQTANDRIIFIPLQTFYTIAEHDEGIQAISGLREGKTVSDVASQKVDKTKVAVDDHDHDVDHDHDLPTATESTTRQQGTTGPTDPHTHPATSAHDHDHDHDHDDDHNDEPKKGDNPHSSDAAHDHAGHDHHDHEKNYTVNADGTLTLNLPKEQWLVSAILVEARGPFQAQSLMYAINNTNEAAAVNPASVMRDFFQIFLEPSGKILLLISILVTVVASVSVLVSIYNSVSARMREIAILRALGATRTRILTLICVEAGLIGLVGAVLGLVTGHALAAAGSVYLQRTTGESINWLRVGPEQWIYLLAVVVIAVLAGLVPAMKAYREPVATNLVA